MNTRKQMLITLCIVLGLSQTPSANAQVSPLGQIASKLIPMAIPIAAAALPIVVTGVITGARVVPLIPAYLKERVPMPHLRRGKGDAAPEAGAPESAESYSAKATVSGSVTPDATSGGGEAAEGEHAEMAPPAEPLHVAAPKPADEEPVAAPPRRKAADNSDWFMEE